MKNSVYERFIEALKEYSMLDGKKSVLVAFSGGADSTALLYLLLQLKSVEVYAAHVNHCIRGEEADRDEKFCVDFCLHNNVILFHTKIDVPRLSEESGQTVEEAARNARYGYFEKIVTEHNIDCIATAHNASDNTETVLMNLVRGTSTQGLCGIPPVRQNIIRPLIFCTKDMITCFCEENGIDFVTDSTNSSTEYRRNYFRHKVIPLLREINPSIDATLSAGCSSVRKDNDYLESVASEHTFSETRQTLASLPEAILSRVVRKELLKHGMKPEADHIRSSCDAIRSQSVHSSLSVPGGTLICDRNSVYTDQEISDIQPSVLKPGVNLYGNDYVIVFQPPGYDFSEEIGNYKNVYKLYTSVQIDSDKMSGSVVVSHKNNCDKYRYGGIGRSVKKLLQSKKMSEREVKSLPVISDDAGIIMIPGFPLRDGLKPDDTTKKICTIAIFNKQTV